MSARTAVTSFVGAALLVGAIALTTSNTKEKDTPVELQATCNGTCAVHWSIGRTNGDATATSGKSFFHQGVAKPGDLVIVVVTKASATTGRITCKIIRIGQFGKPIFKENTQNEEFVECKKIF